MKDDVELPEKIPHKRKQVEQALDLHIAMWLARDDITPSERRRLQEEKDRRKERKVPVVLGFLGSPEGLTPAQKSHVETVLDEEDNIIEAHHGDDFGGDLQFHKLLKDRGIGPIVLHPQTDKAHRAFTVSDRAEKVKSLYERDKDIVVVSSLVVATPREGIEPTNVKDASSMWEAIRYARSRDSNLKVFMPDGTVL